MENLPTQKNTFFTGDNLYILHGMNSESVDLIYLNPPFNSKRIYSAPEDHTKADRKFKDKWTWDAVDTIHLEPVFDKHLSLSALFGFIQTNHGKAMAAYIAFMTLRLFQLHRLLKPTGSLYLHCEPTTSPYLRLVMDTIFGIKNFQDEIIWHHGKKHDTILFYSKSNRYKFYPERIAISTDEAPRPQDPAALLEQIIKTSSDTGDIVLDPFCGGGTACMVAQGLGRRWIGMDIEQRAIALFTQRLGVSDFAHINPIKTS